MDQLQRVSTIDRRSVQKIKDIDHLCKKEIPHGKGSAQKIMGLAWGPNPGDTRMAVCDQLGSLFVCALSFLCLFGVGKLVRGELRRSRPKHQVLYPGKDRPHAV